MSESEVDKLYRKKMAELGGTGRVQRLSSLFDSTREMLRQRVLSKTPGLSEIQVKKEIARIMYRKDKELLKLIPK